MRRTPRSLLVLPLVVALLALVAAPAGAQVSGGTGANPFAPQTETTAPVADADRGDGGIPGWAEALIIASGAVLVLGIGVAITRDARGRAGTGRERVRDPRAPEPAVAGDGGPARKPPRAKQQARARAKRARASRKRNR